MMGPLLWVDMARGGRGQISRILEFECEFLNWATWWQRPHMRQVVRRAVVGLRNGLSIEAKDCQHLL